MIMRKYIFIECIAILVFVLLIQMGAFAEDNREIRFIVNNQEVICRTEPLLTDKKEPLVTLEDLAQMIDITVLWDGKGTSFAVGYGDYALLFYLKDNKIFSAHNYKYDEWKRVESSMKEEVFYSKEKKQFFVPVSKVASFLNIDSMYEMDTENGGTLYLTYNTVPNNMTAEKLVYMDIVAYINQNRAERFNEASEDFQEFAEKRNKFLDAFGIGISHLMDGPKQWFSGLTNAEAGIKEALKIILTSIPENDVVVVDTKTTNTVQDVLNNTKKVLDIIVDLEKKGMQESEKVNEIKNYFEELRKELEKIPQEINIETYEKMSKTYGIASKIYEIAEFSLKPLAIFLSDYEKNIQYLEFLYEALEESGELDEAVKVSIDVLRMEYTNKALNALGELRDAGIEYVITEGANLATGGIFGIGLFTWKSIFEITGVNGKGEALKTFYATFIINGPLDRAYVAQCEKVIQGSAGEDELEKVRLLDNLQKAMKIAMYRCMEQIIDDKETKEYCKIQQEQFSKNCLTWTEQMFFEKNINEDNAIILPDEETENINLFSKFPDNFEAGSDASAWRTIFSVSADGSFYGKFSDYEGSNSGEGYLAEEYICQFDGKFNNLQKVDEEIYSAEIGKLMFKEELGKSYIENQVLYTYVTPLGLENGDAVDIYLPGCPISKIQEDDLKDELVRRGLVDETKLQAGIYLIYNKDKWILFIGKKQTDFLYSEAANGKMTKEEIYNKLVAHYQKGTKDATGESLSVLEGDIYEDGQYHTGIRCGVPGNAAASQRLYDIIVDPLTGEVTQTNALFGETITFNLSTEE